MMLKAKMNIDKYEKELRTKVRKLIDIQPMLKTWGVKTRQKAQANARAKGGRSFWADIAKRTLVKSVSNTIVEVVCHHFAGAIKQFGGIIKPKKAKALTIPIAPEAKGKTAAEFELGGRDLFVLKSDNADPDSRGILGYSDGDQFHALFALRTKSVQKPDPWWPTDSEIIALGHAEADYHLNKQNRK